MDWTIKMQTEDSSVPFISNTNNTNVTNMTEQHTAPIPKITECKNHKLTRTKNPVKQFIIGNEIELIQIYDCHYGDSNDVINAYNIRGTPSDIREYALSHFKKRYWNDLDDFGDGEIIGFSIDVNEENTLFVDCSPIGYESQSWRSYLDLIYPNEFARTESKYIINNNKNSENDQANSFPCSKCGEVFTEESGAERGFICENCLGDEE